MAGASYDVIVVGGGNAAMCAALSAREGGAPGAPAPFVGACHFYFNSLGDFQKAMGAHGKTLVDDIPNYTNISPQIQISEIVG